MSAKARARLVAQWLPVVLFLGFVAVSAIDTNATAANKVPVIASVAAGESVAIAAQLPAPVQPAQSRPAPQPIVIAALAAPAPAPTPPAAAPPPTIAPLISSSPAPSPARFFTINEVMAKHAGRAPEKAQGNIRLASVDPAATPDAADGKSRDTGTGARNDEPFGLFTFVAPDGIVWVKWRKAAADIRAQEPAFLRCLADEAACSPAAARLAAIVKEARAHEGRVRLNFVNQRINNAIRYTSDMTQWGTPDEWSAPLAGGRGSFETGLGDCEDYAIAKYVALRAAGVPARKLRVLLVHDNIARLDHAVLAANDDGRWYVLDNRWTAAVEDSDVRRFTPLFALDEEGVKLLAVPYAARSETRIESMSEAVKGKAETKAEPAETPSASALGLRPSLSEFGLRPSIL